MFIDYFRNQCKDEKGVDISTKKDIVELVGQSHHRVLYRYFKNKDLSQYLLTQRNRLLHNKSNCRREDDPIVKLRLDWFLSHKRNSLFRNKGLLVDQLSHL